MAEENRELTVDKNDCLPAKDLKTSYFHALPVSGKPLCDKTIGDVLDIAVREKPDHVVFRIPEYNQSLTFSELSKKANALSKGFLALGLRKGDIVFSCNLLDEHYFTVYLACALIGLPFLQTYLYQPRNLYLKKMLLKSQPSLIIADVESDSELGAVIEEFVKDRSCADKQPCSSRTSLARVVTVKGKQFEGIPTLDEVVQGGTSLAEATLTLSKDCVSAHDCIYILSSTGSTAEPKFVCISHYAMVNFAIFCSPRRTLGKAEVLGVMSPWIDDLNVSFGTIEMICHWEAGSVMILLPETVNYTENCAVPLLKAIQEHRITRPSILPLHIMKMIRCAEFSNYNTSSVTGVLLVGQAFTPETRKILFDLFPETLVAYGMTENLGITCTHPRIKRSDHIDVGYPFSHSEVKVVDDSGVTLPVEEIGEIWARCPSCFLGYLHNDQLSREVLDSDGWIHTGDLGKMDSQGYLTLYGRKANKIQFKHLGDAVHPGHIEQTVMAFEKVTEATVVGVAVDEAEGESICLCVIPEPGASLSEGELRKYCEEKLVNLNVPSYYFIMDSFPRVGARRKVARAQLQEMVKDKLLLSMSNHE